METRKYILTEEELLNLIECRMELECLQEGGVDNWQYYGENVCEYLANCLNMTENEVEYYGISFKDVAYKILKKYKEVK